MSNTPSRFRGSRLARGFETNPSLEQNGVWRFNADTGIFVKVRRATLPEHKRALRRHYKPFMHLTQIDPKDDLNVKMKAAADVLVADWGQAQEDEQGAIAKDGAGNPIRGPLVDAEGETIQATVETVLEAFQTMPDFFAWVTGEADTFENYRATVVEESSGNSAATSPGNASGAFPSEPPFLSVAPPAVTAPAHSSVVQS